MKQLTYILVTAFAYLLGCLSASIFISRILYGRDVRSAGSGNAGATNMARSFGLLPGIITLLFDAGKAIAAVLIGRHFTGDWGVCIVGAACLIGHCFPVFHRFRGGKGVSVCASIMFFIDWRIGIVVFVLFFVVAFLSRKVSVASVTSAVTIFTAAAAFSLPVPKLLLAFICAITVIFRHKENIERLLNGTEPDFETHKCR